MGGKLGHFKPLIWEKVSLFTNENKNMDPVSNECIRNCFLVMGINVCGTNHDVLLNPQTAKEDETFYRNSSKFLLWNTGLMKRSVTDRSSMSIETWKTVRPAAPLRGTAAHLSISMAVRAPIQLWSTQYFPDLFAQEHLLPHCRISIRMDTLWETLL